MRLNPNAVRKRGPVFSNTSAVRVFAGLICALGLAAPAAANPDRWSMQSSQPLPQSLNQLRLDNPVGAFNPQLRQVLARELQAVSGAQRVVVQLSSPATAAIDGEISGARSAHKNQLLAEQADFIQRSQGTDTNIRVLGQVQHVLNAVFLEVPASALESLALDAQVTRIAPIGDYQMDLSETVPYIGASKVQAKGLDGEGVTVAVLDSGIDYTHADLGGSGDPADYTNNDGTIIEPGTFPTAKVVGGFDFVGNVWPFGPEMFDPDPLDDLADVPGSFAGHGTHVADIIAGRNGVAPGASLYAVKVCASVSSACSGLALILGMEFAVDPNGDGDTSDHVDIINMSLGGTYGQAFDDDLSLSVDNASAIGVLTVAAAGNCGDRPYCTGTPAAAPTALSVAQTNVPSASQAFMEVVEPAVAAGEYPGVRYSWSAEPASRIEALVQYGDLDNTNLDGCAPFANDLSGLIVAVDRGGCFFSDKVRNIQDAGGIAGIVMLVAPGSPFDGAFGGGTPITIPGYNIDQATGDILRFSSATVAFGPELVASLAGVTVGSTARGPGMSFNTLKPEIGAPGASISAAVGTGTGTEGFGGTSGASPMVAGAAALLTQSCRKGKKSYHPYWIDDDDEDDYFWKRWGYGKKSDCSPLKIKSQLVNAGERDIISDTTGALAEVSRIGGGEVRVDRARKNGFWVYSPNDDQPVLGLGHVDVNAKTRLKRRVTLVNDSKHFRFIKIAPSFRGEEVSVKNRRFRSVAKSGPIKISVSPAFAFLPPYSSQSVKVRFVIDPDGLAGNPMSSGIDGNNPAALTAAEHDGHLLFEGWGGESASMPWHVIPRKAAEVTADRQNLVGDSFVEDVALNNTGAGDAQIDSFAIIGLSDQLPRGAKGAQSPTPDIRALGVNTIPVPAGVCSASDSFVWQFAISTWERQTHLLPVSHLIFLDIDQDGLDDYLVLNRDLSGPTTLDDGRQLSWVADLSTGALDAFFFAAHATNTGNTVLTACAEQFGLSPADFFVTNVNVFALAQDFFFGGPSDALGGITISPLGEQYLGLTADIPGNSPGVVSVADFGPGFGNTPESGLMLMTDGDRGAGNHGGATESTEAVLLLAPGVVPPAPLP
ncbi:MAG: S8 family serine peptidase [Pseudomonadota bacterium]